MELLHGVITPGMPPTDPPHAATVTRLVRILVGSLGGRAWVRPQCCFRINEDSLPEPDVAVVEPSDDEYVDAHPSAAHLLVEVAGSSLAADRRSKGPLYASAGVSEYWIVNLRDEVLAVHRAPDRARARYAEIRMLRRGDSASLLVFPDVVIAVDDVLLRPR